MLNTIPQDARAVDVADCMDKLLGPGAQPSTAVFENRIDEKIILPNQRCA
jgi:hypothetical protein